MKVFVRTGLAATVLAGGLIAALPALGQGAGAPPADRAAQQAVNVRQSVMTLVSWNFGPLGGIPRGMAEYDADRVQLSADRLTAITPMIVDAFALDTRESGLESEALPAIWDNRDDFNEKAAALVNAVAQLKAAADADDQDASVAAIGAVGQTCGACHDNYRID